MKGRNQIPRKNPETVYTKDFIDAARKLEANLAGDLKRGASYIDKFSGSYESSVDNIFRRLFSLSPPDERKELQDARDLFRGFDALTNFEKIKVLRRCVERVSAVTSRFGETTSPARSSKPLAKNPSSPVEAIKGVGSSVSSFLAKKGVHTVGDALFYFPSRYEDRRDIKGVSDAVPNSWQTVAGRVESAGRTRPGARVQFCVVLKDGTATLELVWFNFDERYMRSRYQEGKLVFVSGDVQIDPRRRVLQILHPQPDRIEVLDKVDEAADSIHINRVTPVYSLTEGLTQRRARAIMHGALDHREMLADVLPKGIGRDLEPVDDAVAEMHFPEKCGVCPDFSRAAWETGSRDRNLPAPKTVAFLEFFLLQLAFGIGRNKREGVGGISFAPSGDISRRLVQALPFKLTAAQEKAFSLINSAMEKPVPMNILLQGDVGSGKTVVATLAIAKALDSGCQAAIMAPTQILAEQHARVIARYTAEIGIKPFLLKGGDRSAPLSEVESGEARIVIGTHALIQDRVKFNNLGLAVIDEQHKFGVAQREKLNRKGSSPDILVMTATPIPRSLAMTVYGDFDVAVIDTLPAGRKKIETVALGSSPEDRYVMNGAIKDSIEAGRQCYVVCPFIEGGENGAESDDGIARVEETAAAIRREVAGARVGILHGRMPPDEKDSAMEEFVAGGTQVLVSTTVIEVGIDVPNATLMVIENADRFGISQLHQLRGRVGRGAEKSRCILLKSPGITAPGARRLEEVCKNPDGFSIAEADLAMRGPGEFLGVKQSGMPDFRFADLVMDSDVLVEAKEAAREILDKDPELENYPKLREMVDEIAFR
ncbi:MAG: ATP-dependent DNA helicase RecG [Candidatus Mycalebacterium zealandia]|nr:MAG: ATP-dependent DNA helicase RecG [Candidatus Mycalebacterium zealandia]